MEISLLRFTGRLAPCLMLPLASCGAGDFRLFHPRGPVAAAEWRFTLIDVGVMMLIIVPVIFLIALFCWRYRKSRQAAYDPDWSHSQVLELLVWGVPFMIVGLLGYFSYISTYMVNPYAPGVLDAAAGTTAPPPLKVDVITTDWQWFFVYPDQHIATIDDLVVPAGRNVVLRMTSASVTNDFYIPQLAPMMDVMPGMRTEDAFEATRPGSFEGFSADFSGAGFAWMQFSTRVLQPADFASWVAGVQNSPNQLSYAAFQKLAQPTVNEGAKPAYFSNVTPGLFEQIYDAAMQGTVYPVSDALTKSIANVSPQGSSNPETK